VERLHGIAELGVDKAILVGVSARSDANEAAQASAAMVAVLDAI
jgi:hypothetical protein